MEAPPSGSGANEANSSEAAAPRSSSTMARASAAGNGGTSSSVRRQASARGGGNMPGDDAIIWPSFTKVGPRAMNAATSPWLTASASVRRDAASRRRRSSDRGRRVAWITTARTTYAASTAPISAPRTSSRAPKRVRLGAGGWGEDVTTAAWHLPRSRTCSSLVGVDIDDTPEEAAFRAEARAWLDAHAIPKGHPNDFSLGLWTGAYDEGAYIARCQAWQRTLYDGGWAGITWPKEYGGRGGRPIDQVIFGQEQARYGVSNGAFMISIGMAGPTILAHGTEDQKDRFLPPLLRGDELWCQLFSEPRAGSGLAARAVRDGDEWVVTGQKVWTSSPDRARYGMLLARTDTSVPKHQGIGY